MSNEKKDVDCEKKTYEQFMRVFKARVETIKNILVYRPPTDKRKTQ